MQLPNRVVMAPLTRNRPGEDGVPNEMNATYYAQRASAGLIVSEATPVEPRAHGYPSLPGLYTDAQEAGWESVVEAVHEEGGRIFLQLWHVGRISHPLTQPDGGRPVAPSAVRPEGRVPTVEGEKRYVTPRPLETGEVGEIVDAFERSAERAKRAGFDGVELHGGNGYLVDQFLRDGTNRREDRYGGSAEHRVRFLLEVTRRLVGVWGGDRVGVRLSPLSDFNDIADSEPTRTFGLAAERLGEEGVTFLDVVEPTPPEDADEHPIVGEMRERFGGTMMLNGGYDADRADAAIRDGRAEVVSFGRLFLANPDLPERFRRGLPLNEPDPETFYGGGAEGYIDYPTWEERQTTSE